MTRPPDVSVVIPTRARPDALRACLRCLAGQTHRDFEVIVVHDGPDPEGAAAAQAFANDLPLVTLVAPRAGIAVAKNRAIDAARGDLLLLINDDVLPAPEFVHAHVTAHGEQPAMIVGHSPWVPQAPDTLFARVLRESSMVFFYDQMIDAGGSILAPQDHDWGFRHAWNLNCSLPTAIARDVGGFHPDIANCCFEDVEFAWRVVQRHRTPVLFRPQATAPHEHAYTPEGYLERERRLGYSAWGFAQASPDAAQAVFARDLRAPEQVDHCQRLASATPDDDLHEWFRALHAALAPTLAAGADGAEQIAAIYQKHLPLKRRAFAQGFLEAASGARIPGLFACGQPRRPAVSAP
ncbi:MAG: glycosyltransferase [Planctomycetota bacterium]